MTDDEKAILTAAVRAAEEPGIHFDEAYRMLKNAIDKLTRPIPPIDEVWRAGYSAGMVQGSLVRIDEDWANYVAR